MSRQERLARRAARVARQASTVVEQATTRVVSARLPSPAQGEPDPMECKRLRDGGMAWWEIGQKLGLAGPAASSQDPEGKRGAGAARRLYAQANGGAVPRTLAPRKGTVAKPTGPGRDGTLTERKLQLVTQGHVIPLDTPDELIVAMVRGRKIQWAIDVRALSGGQGEPHWLNQEAVVHPDWCIVDEEPDRYGNRTIRFREYLGRDDRGQDVSGPTRTVRVNAIHTIR